MAKKQKEVLGGTVTYRGAVYTNDWDQTKFKATVGDETVYFDGVHDSLVRVGSRIRFEVSARKYDAIRVYKRAKVKVLEGAPEPEVKEMRLKIGYVSYPRRDDRGTGYHCLSKVPKLGWLSIPCRAIEAYERDKDIETIAKYSDYAFPNSGMGWLTAKIESNGRFRVVEILDFEPATGS